MGDLKKLIHELPEIRTDKIEAVKRSIDNGTYTIDPLKIAGKIIEEES
jgi:flagellar biosynthesis anti-sigma factor FlgM